MTGPTVSAAIPLLTLTALAGVLVVAARRSTPPLPAHRRLAPRPELRPTRRRWEGAAASRLVLRHLGHRRRPPGYDEVAAWCDVVARRLRAGESLHVAVRSAEAGPAVATALAPAQLAIERGASVAESTGAARGASRALDDALSVVRVSALVGGPAAVALDRTASALRDRSAIAAERRSQGAQARLSATVLTLLPIGALCLLVATSPSTRAVLTGPVGVICLPTGVLLDVAGWWWIRVLLRDPP